MVLENRWDVPASMDDGCDLQCLSGMSVSSFGVSRYFLASFLGPARTGKAKGVARGLDANRSLVLRGVEEKIMREKRWLI
jgi:hypothetical protein